MDISASSQHAMVKDDQVWLSDGNIVVIAEHVAFRVHKSILAQHSQVFRDILSIPSSHTPDVVDGCEVVHVSDNAEDMRHLLLVLCCGRNYYYHFDEIIPYDVPGVLDPALARLKKYYPITLEAWRDTGNRARYVTSTDPCDAIIAVQLARLTDTSSILPAAFLECCDLTRSLYPETHPRGGSLVLSDLPPRDHAIVISGQLMITKAAAGALMKLFLVVPASGCTSRGRCRRASVSNSAQDFLHFSAGAGLRTGLEMRAAGVLSTICETCRNALVKPLDGDRFIWRLLPTFFGVSVDGWSSKS
ncbi:hypothetical protein C8T65DRAFT_662770 [Cerioporus squamosus]|nr:hypothetical protein C8T65DRAFT_662770 [Cerioporus squamosus]